MVDMLHIESFKYLKIINVMKIIVKLHIFTEVLTIFYKHSTINTLEKRYSNYALQNLKKSHIK